MFEEFDPAEYERIAIDFIRREVDNFRRGGVIFGLSGGIDSACVAGLARKALAKERILGLILPERDSSPESVRDAEEVARTFDIPIKTIDITPILEGMGVYDLLPESIYNKRKIIEKGVKIGYKLIPKSRTPFLQGLLGVKSRYLRTINAYYRVKHRIRMVIIYLYAERLNYLVLGTSNRSEELTGFFVKYGDGAADVMPIAPLFKTEVKRMAEYLKVPKRIIDKPPTPDLLPGITDELAIGMDYERLDRILASIDKGLKEKKESSEFKYVRELIKRSEHMRSLPKRPDIK